MKIRLISSGKFCVADDRNDYHFLHAEMAKQNNERERGELKNSCLILKVTKTIRHLFSYLPINKTQLLCLKKQSSNLLCLLKPRWQS